MTTDTFIPHCVADEIQPGVYAINGDGEFEAPASHTIYTEDGEPRQIPGILALHNTGARDCTARIIAKEDVHECQCDIHIMRHGTHAAGTQFGQFTLFAGRGPTHIHEYVPGGSPLLVRIKGFVPGEPPTPVEVPDSLPIPISNPYGFDTTPRPAPEAASCDGEKKALLAVTQSTVAPLSAAPHLFPGFVVSCAACRSVDVSINDMQGKVYLECEDCGAMCRIKV